MTDRMYLNDNWKFGTYTEAFLQENYDGGECVRLPHTCAETPFHYFDESIYQMVSGYRRSIEAYASWKGKKVLLTFEGVAHGSEVYLNGEKIAEHHCGYTAFTVDLSDRLRYGEGAQPAQNHLVVRVDSRETQNIPPFGYVVDYMTYGGIYRDVYLEVKEPTHLEDVFVYSTMDEREIRDGDIVFVRKAVLHTAFTVEGDVQDCSIRQSIRCCTQEEFQEILHKPLSECKAGEEGFLAEQGVANAQLWDTDAPVLYEVRTQLMRGEEVLDEKRQRFGFRLAKFRADGFYLNGRRVKLRGLNRHQSYPYVGYAMPSSMQKWDADLLKKELGVNAVRTSHYPQSHHFLDRCDELGLLVFTEIPGWQHIGDDAWKEQALRNTEDMVRQYRNHPSIILWGVRINESQDDDALYRETNAIAHRLDPTRATGGVRAMKHSSLLEDVYTYNDFSHEGTKPGCEPKRRVTSDEGRAYLISEYNGHMYPTKSYDCEEHRVEHMMRHARVLDAVKGQEDIAGSFGWCMFDYNTHKDFGSGDRICYHGVMDMFRNPKMAAAVYACQQDTEPVLEVCSSMDIGEHPACERGNTYLLTNADSVRMYKNDRFIKEYTARDAVLDNLPQGPWLIDDYIGDAIEKQEQMSKEQAADLKKALNAVARYGLSHMPKSLYLTAAKLMTVHRMSRADIEQMYIRYIGDWGGEATSFRFEAVKRGSVVRTVQKETITKICLRAEASHTTLREEHTYDVAAVRIQAVDGHGNILPFFQEPVLLRTEGGIDLIGPSVVSLQGGMGGTYVRTTGKSGAGALFIKTTQMSEIRIAFQCEKEGDGR